MRSLNEWVPPVEPPSLGDRYLADTELVQRRIDNLFQSIRSWLDGYDEDWFEDSFTSTGEASDDIAKRKQAVWREEAEHILGNVFQWYQAGLGRPGLMADFDYWSNMASFKLDEITLLSLGLEPTEYFRERLNPDKLKRKKTCPADEFAMRRFEVFRRKFAHGNMRATVFPRELVEWFRAVKLDTHPGFQRMIDTIASREEIKFAEKTSSSEEAKPDLGRAPEGREVASLAKLLTAIAMEEYGYDPTSRRSPIPREIQDISDRHGLSVSQDTIRKYLQTGARYLPNSDEAEE